jgi:hypothetical protein
MAVVHDKAFVAGAANGEIGGAFRALRVMNDLLAEGLKADGEPAA